ncbi:hypothetical protein [Streptosporangium jomthongense]|uniref:Transposase n=1 Tax=Streptosporangium jomthongense TaxID=1193683 RepID=A0ABV8FG70_9ACTN
MIIDKRRPGKVVRRHFEICVFSCLADELVRGDVAAVGSEAYANWQSQLLSWEDCQPYLAEYCAEAGLPTTAADFVAQLKMRMKAEHVAGAQPAAQRRRDSASRRRGHHVRYQEDNVRRFGDYVYDLNAPLEDMEVNLELGEETDAAREAPLPG